MKNGFDKLAAPYRWMEYASFGRALERCRFAFLPKLRDATHALLLGDGDGRFTAAFLREAENVDAVAVDGSAAMLHALLQRCEREGSRSRVTTMLADLRGGLPDVGERSFDLVATHFFLDCLSDAEVHGVVRDVGRCVVANARWIVSEFRVPPHGVMRWPSQLLVRGLYRSFRMMTGLRAERLPLYRNVLVNHGWRMECERPWLRGLLVSELWVRDAVTAEA